MGLEEKLLYMDHVMIGSRAQLPTLQGALYESAVKEVDALIQKMALELDGAKLKRIVADMPLT